MKFDLSLGEALDAAIKGGTVRISPTESFTWKEERFIRNDNTVLIVEFFANHKFSTDKDPILKDGWVDALEFIKNSGEDAIDDHLEDVLDDVVEAIEVYEAGLLNIFRRGGDFGGAFEVLAAVRGEEFVRQHKC